MINRFSFLAFMLLSHLTEAQVPAQRRDSVQSGVRPLISDRPGISESAFLLFRGDLQVESGFNYESDSDVSIRQRTFTYASTSIKYGVSKRFELRVGADYVRHQEQYRLTDTQQETQGLLPLSIGTKVHLLEEKRWLPQVSLIGSLQLPLAAKAFQTTYVAPAFKFSIHHTLSKMISLSYNLGGKWDGTKPESTQLYTLCLGCSLSERLGMFVESYGFLSRVEAPDHRVDTGFSYLLSNTLQIDISGGLGLSANSPDGFVNGGFSWRITKP